MNRNQTTKLLTTLASVWSDETIDDAKINAYEWALSEMPYEIVEQAVKVWLRRSKWFPKPAELLDLITESAVPAVSSGEAWEVVMKQIRLHGFAGSEHCEFGDETILAAVKAVGWRRICLDDNSDGYVRRDFDLAMKAAQERRRREVQSGFVDALPERHLTALPRVS